MKQSSKLLCKVLTVAMALAVVGTATVALPAEAGLGTNISVSAATSSPVVTVGDYQYILYSDKTAKVVGYTGTKNLSSSNVGMPTVIYSKDIDTTWEYNQYIGSYNITSMQAGIFSGCKFKTLSLPRYLESIIGGFTGAEIGGFFIDSSNNYFSSTYYSGAYALYNKSNTTLYAYPSNPELYVSGFGTATKGFPSTLTRIEDQAFANSKLYTVTIPASVTYVGDRLFYNSNVHYAVFEGSAPTFRFMPSSTIPDHGTFEGATGLYQITIKGKGGSYNTDSYGNVYNQDMTKLVLVPQGKTSAFNVASTCTEIGDYAFYHSNANGPVIYDQVKTIGSSAFSGVKSNFKVYCLKDTPTDTFVKNHNVPYTYIYEYTTASDGVTITKYNGPYSSPGVPTKINGKDVIAIGNEAFRNNDTLSAVYLYSPLAAIGDYAFYDCDNLTKVSMPYTVTSIGERAFYSCNKLNFTTLPSKLTKIGIYAFGYCEGLTEVTIPNSVTQLNYSAFYGCSGLTSVKFGTGLKTIGAYAFENTGLTSQYIPKNVSSVGDYAFGFNYASSKHTRDDKFEYISGYPDSAARTYANKHDIPFRSVLEYSLNSGKIQIEKYTGTDTAIVIPDSISGYPVTSIKAYAFNGTNVTSVTLPSSMTALSGYAFYGASKLTSVTIPSSITSIGEYAFGFCSSLKSITIPATVKSIGNGAFYGCTSLANVYFKEGLRTIGGYAFENTALTAVTLPSTVTSIGVYAFADNYSSSTHTPVTGFIMTGYVDTAAEDYAVMNQHITFKPLYLNFFNNSSIDKESMTLGDTLTITASSSGGKKPYDYAVYYKKSTDSSYTTLQSYSSNTKITFTPASSGTYVIMVTAADYRGVTSSKTFSVIVKASALINNSTVSATSVTVGDAVVINSKASGGEGAYTYAANISSNNGGSFTTLRAYAADSAITFVPEKSGTYILRSFVKDSNGTVTSKDFTVTVKAAALVNKSEISETDIMIGTPITVDCKAEGGEGEYQYQVLYQKYGDQNWSTVQQYSTNAAVTINLASAGTYSVVVNVKDGNGATASAAFSVNVKYLLSNASSISAAAVKAGESVTVNCSASGGTGSYVYTVRYQPEGGEWEYVQQYDTKETVEIPFTAAGTYSIVVIVRDDDFVEASKTFTVTVESDALKNESTLSKTTITLGETVTVTGKASGGTAPYTYAVQYKKASVTSWTTAQAFKENNVIKLKLLAAVKYNVCVKVKDSKGTIAKLYFTVNVVKPLENNSTLSAETIKKGETITAEGKAAGGTAPYLYGVYYKKQTSETWTTAQSYKSQSTVNIKPAAAVKYAICIKVKDSTGKIVKKYFVLTVTK